MKNCQRIGKTPLHALAFLHYIEFNSISTTNWKPSQNDSRWEVRALYQLILWFLVRDVVTLSSRPSQQTSPLLYSLTGGQCTLTYMRQLSHHLIFEHAHTFCPPSPVKQNPRGSGIFFWGRLVFLPQPPHGFFQPQAKKSVVLSCPPHRARRRWKNYLGMCSPQTWYVATTDENLVTP